MNPIKPAMKRSAAAERFIAGLIGFMHVRALLGVAAPTSTEAIQQHVAEVVRHFLANCDH